MAMLDWSVPAAACTPVRPVDLSIVVPTFNERDNLIELVDGVAAALAGVSWEVIFVDDDSPDETAALARRLHRSAGQVRVLQRLGRRGLSSACIEGMLASSAPFLIVMDADLQHDPALLPVLFTMLRHDRSDLVVASRYMPGGELGDWTPARARISRLATRTARWLLDVSLTDPMSGYFGLRRELLETVAPRLSGVGFKILLDLVLSAPSGVRLHEVPFRFGVRRHGESKLSARVVWDLALLVLDKTIGRVIPVRFLAFASVGAFGVLVHFSVLAAAMALSRPFVASQVAATATAIVINYAINNALTYRDRARRGWRWLTGLFSFALICGFGAAANIGVAAFLFDHQARWPLAALAGVLAGAVWNYAASARYTWGGR